MIMDVTQFLKRFHFSKNITDVFLNGCCYWFATIMYDEVINHFGTKIEGRVYDITGDVTFKYEWKPWPDVNDELFRARIVRDCIMF